MARTYVAVLLLLAMFCLVASGPAQTRTGTTITGTLSYDAMMPLPSDAAIDVRLEDVSLADAPSKLIAENVFAVGQLQPPVPFQVPYNAAGIEASHHYVVRATFASSGVLLFTTTQLYPVLTNGAGNDVALTLNSVGSASAPTPTAPTALRGTKWMLIELDGKPVAPSAKNPASLLLDADQKRYSGSSGCNRITGTFQLNGNDLQLLGGAMTMMACPEALMKQEKDFSAALTATGSYQISGNVLELLERKKVVAKFNAASSTTGN